MTATNIPPRPAPIDMAHHAHLSGVFAPQREEVDVRGLAVTVEIPADLHGSYLRNGPNPRFDPIGTYVYPLDGDAMVHRIELADGGARYTNRFVRTPMVVAEEKAGHAIWSGITDGYAPSEAEVGPDLAGTMRQLPDINIVRHGGRLMAMAEADLPYGLNPPDLATLARENCDGAIGVGSTAHPKIDPTTGELFIFNYEIEAPFLTWSVVNPDGTVSRPPTPVDGMDNSYMIHDMAITSTYLVIMVCPLVFDLAGVMSGGSLLDWRPDDGTRIALIPRDGGPVRWLHTDPFWVWHFANAYDDPGTDGGVIVDYVEWTYPNGFAHEASPSTSSLTRARIDPATGTVSRDAVISRDMEFPRIDDRLITKQHKHIAAAGRGSSNPDALDGLWFFDPATGKEVCWNPNVAVGEPIYLPGDEHDYWGAIGTDPTDMSSHFYILPADDSGSGPLATIHLPIRVPAGLHGAWLAD